MTAGPDLYSLNYHLRRYHTEEGGLERSCTVIRASWGRLSSPRTHTRRHQALYDAEPCGSLRGFGCSPADLVSHLWRSCNGAVAGSGGMRKSPPPVSASPLSVLHPAHACSGTHTAICRWTPLNCCYSGDTRAGRRREEWLMAAMSAPTPVTPGDRDQLKNVRDICWRSSLNVASLVLSYAQNAQGGLSSVTGLTSGRP